MKIKILITIILFVCLQAFSQEKENKSFNLNEAIQYALQHNRAIKNAIRDIEIAKKQKWQTTATGLPQINAEVSYNNWLKQQVSLIDINGDGKDDELVFGTKQTMNATATLTQKLFDGSYLVGLQSAKVFLEISKNAKEKTDLEIRKATINAYGNVLLAKQSIEILQRNILNLEKNLNETTKIYENGLTELENVEQLQITLSGLNSKLQNAKKQLLVAKQMFNLTIGLEVNTNSILTDTLDSLVAQNLTSNTLQNNTSLQNNIDFKIAQNDIRAKQLLVKLEKSKYLPTLNAFLNGAYAANSNNFTFTNNNQRWFGSSLLGVSLRVPIFSSGLRSAATQQAKINLEKANENLLQTQEQLKLQIASAQANFQYAISEYENKKNNLELAKRIENKNEIKFFEGIATSFELRQAQQQLYAAQQELLQAMLEVINKKVNLETVLNTINE